MKKLYFENNIWFLINNTAKALTRTFDQELRQKGWDYFRTMEGYCYASEL